LILRFNQTPNTVLSSRSLLSLLSFIPHSSSLVLNSVHSPFKSYSQPIREQFKLTLSSKLINIGSGPAFHGRVPPAIMLYQAPCAPNCRNRQRMESLQVPSFSFTLMSCQPDLSTHARKLSTGMLHTLHHASVKRGMYMIRMSFQLSTMLVYNCDLNTPPLSAPCHPMLACGASSLDLCACRTTAWTRELTGTS
jgi:hypothetical protein